MGQVFSYIWKWIMIGCHRVASSLRDTLHGKRGPTIFSKLFYFLVRGWRKIILLWKYMRRNLVNDSTTKTVSGDQSEQQSHYFTIPDHDDYAIVTIQPVTGTSNIDVVPSGQTHALATPDEVPFIVVDLIDINQETNTSNRAEQEHDELMHLVTNKEVITEVLATPFKQIGPYTSLQRILLVGEGDFSFSASLAVAFGSASNIIATSLNSQDFLTKNYPKFLTNKMKLEVRGCMVIHDVDATDMFTHSVLGTLRFDRIIFNFPHTGSFGRSDKDMSKNRNLIRGFLRSAKKMINEDGEIHITHKSNGYFRQWDIPKIGSDQGLHLIKKIKFQRKMYPGYYTKFGFGGDRYFHCNPSKTYMFGMYTK